MQKEVRIRTGRAGSISKAKAAESFSEADSGYTRRLSSQLGAKAPCYVKLVVKTYKNKSKKLVAKINDGELTAGAGWSKKVSHRYRQHPIFFHQGGSNSTSFIQEMGLIDSTIEVDDSTNPSLGCGQSRVNKGRTEDLGQ